MFTSKMYHVITDCTSYLILFLCLNMDMNRCEAKISSQQESIDSYIAAINELTSQRDSLRSENSTLLSESAARSGELARASAVLQLINKVSVGEISLTQLGK